MTRQQKLDQKERELDAREIEIRILEEILNNELNELPTRLKRWEDLKENMERIIDSMECVGVVFNIESFPREAA